jgi:hypothetical protein
MSPIKLSDAELDAVMSAARPLDVAMRDQFLQEVAQSLAACPVIGPGSVYRAAAQVQAKFWSPPDLSRSSDQSKYRR